MSLHLNFEPHSWYKGAAIRDNWGDAGHDQTNLDRPLEKGEGYRWTAYYLDGNSGYIREFNADTLGELKQYIKEYHEAQAARDAYNRARIGEK